MINDEMASDEPPPPKVFISYSHDSKEFMDRVLDLSNRLRDDGVDCTIDQYEVSPIQGWPRWCEDQLERADYVLVVCTETYRRRFRAQEVRGMGLGGKWEGAIITQELYDAETNNSKFIPVVFAAQDVASIPKILRGATQYLLDDKDGYENLYRHITKQPTVIKPRLGKLRALSPIERKHDFSPLELERRDDENSDISASDHDADDDYRSREVTTLDRWKPTLTLSIQVVAFLFAAFGGFLTGIAPPEQVSPKFAVGFSSFLVLIVLLIVAAISKDASVVKFRRRWIYAGIIFFVLAVASGLTYPWTLSKLTYAYPPPPDEPVAQHVNGWELTETAKDFLKENPEMNSPGQLELNLPYESIWTEESIFRARIILLVNYILLVLSIAGAVFSLLEVNIRGR